MDYTPIPVSLNNLLVTTLSTHPPKRPESMYDLQVKLDEIAKEMGVTELDLKGLAVEEKAPE